MKKIILLVFLSLVLIGCATLSFKDVAEPFFKKYGFPTNKSFYQTTRYAFQTWTWWDEKIKVTFIEEHYGWRWKVYSIYEW